MPDILGAEYHVENLIIHVLNEFYVDSKCPPDASPGPSFQLWGR